MFGVGVFNTFTLNSENKKTFNAPKTEAELLTGYAPATDENGNAYTLDGIMRNYCPDIGRDEVCSAGPFTQFTIRGAGGTINEHSDSRWYYQDLNTLVLKDYDKLGKKSGAVEIDVRNGYQVKLKIELTNAEHGKAFKENAWGGWGTNDTDGVVSKGELTATVILTGGDKLSIDIDSEWAGTTEFYLKVQGNPIVSSNYNVNDQVKITLLGVWFYDASQEESSDDNGGSSNDNSNDDSTEEIVTDEGLNLGTIALLGIAGVGAFVLLR